MLIAALFASLALASKLLIKEPAENKLRNTLQEVLGGDTDHYVKIFTNNWYDNPEIFDSEPLSDFDLKYIGLNDAEINQWRKTYPNLLQDLPMRGILTIGEYMPDTDYRNLINAMENEMDKVLLENVWNYAPLFRLHLTQNAFQFYSSSFAENGNGKGYKEGPLKLMSGRTLHSITFKLLDAMIPEKKHSCILFEHQQMKGADQYMLNLTYTFKVEYVKDENKFKLTICDKTTYEKHHNGNTCTEKYFSKDAKFQLSEKTLKIMDGKENQEILDLTIFGNNVQLYKERKHREWEEANRQGHSLVRTEAFGRFPQQGFKFFNPNSVWQLLEKQTVEEKREHDRNEDLKELTPTLPQVAKDILLLYIRA